MLQLRWLSIVLLGVFAVPAGAPADDRPRNPRERSEFPSLYGSTGGFHLSDADGAARSDFRLQLTFGWFHSADFPVDAQDHDHIAGVIAGSGTVTSWLELFGSLESRADSSSIESADGQQTELLQALGDVRIGAKAFWPVRRGLMLGGELSLMLPTQDDLGLALGATSVSLGTMLTADFRRMARLPLIARANLRYSFDNSAELVQETEDARYVSLADPRAREDENRHLITASERFALQIDRVDTLSVGFGFEVPLKVAENFSIHPLGEFVIDAPINRQGYDCVSYPASSTGANLDGCLDKEGAAAVPMTLTLGARFAPPVRGLSSLLALDIGVSGSDAPVVELAPNVPWKLFVGFTYAFRPWTPMPEPEPIVREIERRVEIAARRDPTGVIRGRVFQEGTENPMPGVRIHYVGPRAAAADQATADDGSFTSDSLPPGDWTLELSHREADPASCRAAIPTAGGDVEVRCSIVKRLVRLEEREIEILEQVNFAFDSDVIIETSFPLLTQIAQTLTAHPEIRRVEIQGHTDDQGRPEHNDELSQSRAESVRRWLLERGVDASRLVARGYGQRRPLVQDITEEARAKNRRVQFMILERGQPQAP